MTDDKTWVDGWQAGFLACLHLMAPRGNAQEWRKMRDEMLVRRCKVISGAIDKP